MSTKRKREKYTEERHKKSSEEEQSPTEDEPRHLGEESKGEEEKEDSSRSLDEGDRREDFERGRTPHRSPRREEREDREPVRRSRRERRRSREPDATSMMGELTSYFDNKFSALKRELFEEHDNISERLDKRFKPEREFKRKTNKFQFDHNNEITASMKKAKKNLLKNPPNIRKAVQVLDSGIAYNDFRTKCICIADRFEGGWATVEEYLQNELASDSEDDKRLRKAESAVAKKKEFKQKSFRGRSRPFNRNQFFPRQNSFNNNFNPGFNDHTFNFIPRGGPRGGRRRGCFNCGDFAHWKDQCPRNRDIPAAAGAPTS